MENLSKREWVVMFVDVVGSTEMKYRFNDDAYAFGIRQIYNIIREQSVTFQAIKFTGDGAMVIFRRESNNKGCLLALQAAERIFQDVEHLNLSFIPPRIRFRLRAGIATGGCYMVSNIPDIEIIGKPVDLAARLCSEADPDTILIDETTKRHVRSTYFQLTRISRHLALKGVSETERNFYQCIPRLLTHPLQKESYSKGLLSLYSDREELAIDFNPPRIIKLAARESTITIAGRTLISWSDHETIEQIVDAIAKNSIKFRLLVLSKDIEPYLDPSELDDHYSDLERAKKVFLGIQKRVAKQLRNKSDYFELKQTNTLILDSITCATIQLPLGTNKQNATNGSADKLIALQDINAATLDSKACLLFICTCEKPEHLPDKSCMAHELLARAIRIYSNGTRL